MNDDNESINLFELFTAIVLGLGAIGGAWAGFQAGLWGGNQATAYSEAGNLMAEAARIASEAGTDATEASQTANRDADIDLQAKRLLFDATRAIDKAGGEQATGPQADAAAAEIKHQLLVAKYLYAEQMSEAAYKFLGLPEKENFEDITDDELLTVVEKGLDEKYFDELYADSEAQYDLAEEKQAEAKKKFAEGQLANYNGDLNDFSGVLFTVVMFLAGIGLVFKTRIRWAFGGAAAIGLVASSLHLFNNPWTKLEAPAPEAPASAEASSGPAPSGTAK